MGRLVTAAALVAATLAGAGIAAAVLTGGFAAADAGPPLPGAVDTGRHSAGPRGLLRELRSDKRVDGVLTAVADGRLTLAA